MSDALPSRRRVLAGGGALGVVAAVDGFAVEPAWLVVLVRPSKSFWIAHWSLRLG
jgi:hypothetical protein